MTLQIRLKVWVLPIIGTILFFSCIITMVTAPNYYDYEENDVFVQVWVTKDKDHATVRTTTNDRKKTTKKYAVISATEGDADILGSFSNGKYHLAKNGNLRLDNNIEIPAQRSMRYSVAAATLIVSIALGVCIAFSAK